MRVSDAEIWHQTQLNKVAALSTLEGTDFRRIIQEVGAWFLKGCKRVEDLKSGLIPTGFYNERHLLNTALSHIKSAFESMEIIAKSPGLRDGAARPIAIQYFVQVYLLLLPLWKVAYGKEFDDYFEGWGENLVDPDRLLEFDTLDPMGLYIEQDIRNISWATVLPPGEIPRRDFPFLDVGPEVIPKAFPSDRTYGKAIVHNAFAQLAPDTASSQGGGKTKRSRSPQSENSTRQKRSRIEPVDGKEV